MSDLICAKNRKQAGYSTLDRAILNIFFREGLLNKVIVEQRPE